MAKVSGMVTGDIHIASWELKFSDIPQQIQRVFSKQDQEIFEQGATKLIELLKGTGEKRLIDLCQLIKLNHPIHVHIEDLFGDPQIWFGLTFVKLASQVRIRTPGTSERTQLPQRLATIFNYIGGLCTCTPYSPRLNLHEAKDLKIDDKTHEAKAVKFFQWGNGDGIVCRRNGSIFKHLHETHSVVDLSETCWNDELDFFLAKVCEEHPAVTMLRKHRHSPPT